MQFHLNGFRCGDPDLQPQADGADQTADAVDVLIVGCGPAGLTLATQLSRFPDIATRIVEQKGGPMEKGQADGVSCRSMEMFQAFGFAEQVMREAYRVNETAFWKPDPARPDRIIRSGRVPDVEEGLSEMPHVILNQARIHDLYLQAMEKSPRRLRPDYGRRLAGLTVDDTAADHPVTATLERTDPGHEGESETIRARCVVGCDGARSAVRRAIGRELRGDSANHAWGVMDVLAVTDFPDIRMKTLIRSRGEGTVLIIPREGGYLVRLYIELDQLNPDERIADRNITVDRLIAAAQRIFRPHAIEVKDVVWWSVYQIGQRLTDAFDDATGRELGREPGREPRVFIAGDACHTHSPKAGQGMNVSMGDAFNLGWKLAAVLRGAAGPGLLGTYSEERRGVASDLIDFDREWAGVLASQGAGGQGATPLFQDYFIRHGRYTAGVAVRYAASVLTGAPTWQHLAPGFEIGTRFHSAPVVRRADARPMHLGHVIEADGRWRLFAFAGRDGGGLADLCRYLDTDPASPLRRFTPAGADPDQVIDLRAVLQADHAALSPDALPALLLPRKGIHGLIDYEKVFCADPRAGPDIFDLRRVDRDAGCLVIVRPDQHVAHVLPLDAHGELAGFFAGFMRDPPRAHG